MEHVLAFVHVSAAAVFPVGLAYAAVRDLVSMEIPNWVSIAILAAFFPTALATGWGGEALADHVLAGALILAAGWALCAAGIVGGGDAKLLAAAAVWTGWGMLPAFLFAVALSGGVLGLALLVFRRVRLAARLDSLAWVRHLHAETKTVPYGVAIAAGGVLVFLRLPVVVSAAG